MGGCFDIILTAHNFLGKSQKIQKVHLIINLMRPGIERLAVLFGLNVIDPS